MDGGAVLVSKIMGLQCRMASIMSTKGERTIPTTRRYRALAWMSAGDRIMSTSITNQFQRTDAVDFGEAGKHILHGQVLYALTEQGVDFRILESCRHPLFISELLVDIVGRSVGTRCTCHRKFVV